ncbi:MAG: beta-propeller fold lactonase family protein [Terracidiphilus sp.]
MNTNRFLAAALSLLILLTAGCGGNANQASSPLPTSKTNPDALCVPSSTPEFAYVLTGYAVSMYTVNSCTGVFIPTTPASVATGYANPQAGAEQMVVDPAGRFAYVANLVSNATDQATISMFTINPATGVLTPTSPATVPTGFFPQGIAIDPTGSFIYTADSDDNAISIFTVNQTTGVLTATTPAEVPTGYESSPGFVTVDPSGKFLYTAGDASDDSTIAMFTINSSTGLLTPTTPAKVYTGPIPFDLAVAPNGKFAYVVNNDSGMNNDIGVAQYTVDSLTGVLTQNSPAFVATGNSPTAIAIDPTSKYAYVVNRNDNTVSMYTIDPATGNLTLNATAANPTGTIATGNSPFRITFDPSGKFLYVTNEGGIAASIYSVNPDGTLAAKGTTGPSIYGGLSIAITAVK